MGGMQAPQYPHPMRKIMVNKMRELPRYVAQNKPVPGKAKVVKGILCEKPDAKPHHGNGNNPADKGVKHISKKRNFVRYDLKSPVKRRADDLHNQQKRYQRAYERNHTIISKQSAIIARLNNIDQVAKAKKVLDLGKYRVQKIHHPGIIGKCSGLPKFRIIFLTATVSVHPVLIGLIPKKDGHYTAKLKHSHTPKRIQLNDYLYTILEKG
jgi:hypothetical protein